ncbi:MAG TPA: hypothetical protein VK212_09355 [Lentimicrobium sp.]|nr:hypothetical protein [Lentimicrobium sp.]
MLTKYNLSNKVAFLLVLTSSIFLLNSCELVGDIFEAGVWTGVIIIVLVVALLIYIFAKLRRRD